MHVNVCLYGIHCGNGHFPNRPKESNFGEWWDGLHCGWRWAFGQLNSLRAHCKNKTNTEQCSKPPASLGMISPDWHVGMKQRGYVFDQWHFVDQWWLIEYCLVVWNMFFSIYDQRVWDGMIMEYTLQYHHWLVLWNMNGLWLSIKSWEFHHPNWRFVHHFSEGWPQSPVKHSIVSEDVAIGSSSKKRPRNR